jgi:hypothetical protein
MILRNHGRICCKGLQLCDVDWNLVNKTRDLLANDRNGQHHQNASPMMNTLMIASAANARFSLTNDGLPLGYRSGCLLSDAVNDKSLKEQTSFMGFAP